MYDKEIEEMGLPSMDDLAAIEEKLLFLIKRNRVAFQLKRLVTALIEIQELKSIMKDLR